MSMVTRLLTNYQLENLSRQQICALKHEHQKVLARLKKLTWKTNLPITFDNTSITGYGNFGLFETFKNAIGYKELLQKHFTVNRHHNCRYSPAELADILGDCITLGMVRFDHMNNLKFDPGYRKIKGLERVPDERTFRYLLAKLSVEDLEKLKTGCSKSDIELRVFGHDCIVFCKAQCIDKSFFQFRQKI